MTNQRPRRKSSVLIDRRRSRRRVETRLHLQKRKILQRKRQLQRRRRNHRLHTRVHHRGVIVHRRGIESKEEGLLGGIQGRGESVPRLDGEECRGRLEDTTDTRCREAGVDRGTIAMDLGADRLPYLDAEDPTPEEGQDPREDRGTDGRGLENVAGAAAGLGAGPGDLL